MNLLLQCALAHMTVQKWLILSMAYSCMATEKCALKELSLPDFGREAFIFKKIRKVSRSTQTLLEDIGGV